MTQHQAWPCAPWQFWELAASARTAVLTALGGVATVATQTALAGVGPAPSSSSPAGSLPQVRQWFHAGGLVMGEAGAAGLQCIHIPFIFFLQGSLICPNCV